MNILNVIIQLLPYGIEFTQSVLKLVIPTDPALNDWLAVLDTAKTPFDKGLNQGAIIPNKTSIVTDTVITPAVK